MNVHLHIERLVLDGVPVGPGQADAVQAAVRIELARLLGAGGLAPELAAGAAIAASPGGTVRLVPDATPTRLGADVAGAVYRALGPTDGGAGGGEATPMTAAR